MLALASLLGLLTLSAPAPAPGDVSAPGDAPASHPAELGHPSTQTSPPVAPRFPEPARVRPQAPAAREPTPSRFTGRQRLVRPTLRIAPGFVGRWTERPYAAFGFDVLASVLVGLHPGPRQFGLGPELGYSLRAPGLSHDALAGVSLVYGLNTDGASFGLLPRAVLRSSQTGLAAGLRTGLWYDFAENGFSVELSHQWTRALAPAPGAVVDQHELRLSVGLDLLMLAFVLNRRSRVGFI